MHSSIFYLLLLIFPSLSASLPSFPGAVGFGSDTPGGRGGAVLVVTSLADSGPGTLRAALAADAVPANGPRTVVFNIGGTITVSSALVVPSHTTIAGQTAPADSGGITIKADPSLGTQTMTVSGDDVIVRFLRFRRGASTSPTCCGDNILVYEASNVVLDHLSVSWAIDENLNSWGAASNITLSNCISSEALYDSSHEKGPHSMGLLFGDGRNASVVRSLFSRNVGRNPRMDLITGIEVVNNLIVSTTNTIEIGHNEYPPESVFDVDATEVNVVGNRFLHYSSRNGVLVGGVEDNPYRIYVKDNIGCQRTSTSQPETDIVGNSVNSGDPPANYYTTTPNDFPTRTLDEGTVFAHDAVQAHVLAHAGCTRPTRDAVDDRVIADVLKMTNLGRVDDPSDVGGWPTLAAGTPRTDTDGDGIPDAFETSLGTSPTDGADGAIVTASGYSNLELWLNSAELLGDEYVVIPNAPSPSSPGSPSTTGSPGSPGSPGSGGVTPGSTVAGGGTTAATGAGGDGASVGEPAPGDGGDSSSDNLPLYITIAALAVLVVALAVALVVSRMSASSAKAYSYDGSAGTRMSTGARRRSSHYRHT
jgi:hypothetical protein